MSRALAILETLGKLLAFGLKAIAEGKPERVEKILPMELHTTLARAAADAEAEERFARRDEPTRPVIRDAGNGQ